MATLTLLIAGYCLIVGAAVIWANPRRFAHQCFGIISAISALWLLAVSRAMVLGPRLANGETVDLAFWLRANAAIAAYIPAAICLLREALVHGDNAKKTAIRRTIPFLVFGAVVSTIAYHKSFLLNYEPGSYYVRGASYYAYNVIYFFGYCAMAVGAMREIKKRKGVQRIELQLLTTAFLVQGIILNVANPLGNYFRIRVLNQSSVLIVFVVYTFLAWAITYRRIFDARHVFLNLTQRLGILVAFGFSVFGLRKIDAISLPSPFDVLMSILICGAIAWWLDHRLRVWLGLDDTVVLQEWRAEVIAVARTSSSYERIVGTLEAFLKQRCDCESAAFILCQVPVQSAPSIESLRERAGFSLLCELGWATPETLIRRRSSVLLDDLRGFMQLHSLGLLVTAPDGSPHPSLVLAFGTKRGGHVFTYPEIERLQNIAELMDNILTHSRLTPHAALQAKIEHLAMMSRGLAHDLKNLITPVSSFLIHTEGHYPPDSPDAEVHAAARQSVRIMTEYVRESMFFSERLQPKFELVDLGAIFRTVQEITSPRAQLRGVAVSTRADNIHSFAADAVLLQRLFANLVTNAIDASAAGQTVTIVAVADREGWLQVQVTDKGQGISPENLRRIFDPYFTTKDLGSETRGFGLGLTICQKIVNLHGGIIRVKSQLHECTCVTVSLPATEASERLLPTKPCLALP